LDQGKGAQQVDSEQIKQIILAKVGLTDSELRDYLRKLSGFYVSLTPKEQEAFRSGTCASEKDALKSFGGKITAKELEAFIKSREPKDAGVKPIMILHCKCDDDEAD
jgi:hypothetical protein